MIGLPEKLSNSLMSFNQKPLSNGEIFLLAKAIADEIPLMDEKFENVRLFTLRHKNFIENVIYKINEYTYTTGDQQRIILELIDNLCLWRYMIASEPPVILFRNDQNTVIDDISCLPRYIDINYLCSVGDIVDEATFIYTTFRELAKICKGV